MISYKFFLSFIARKLLFCDKFVDMQLFPITAAVTFSLQFIDHSGRMKAVRRCMVDHQRKRYSVMSIRKADFSENDHRKIHGSRS